MSIEALQTHLLVLQLRCLQGNLVDQLVQLVRAVQEHLGVLLIQSGLVLLVDPQGLLLQYILKGKYSRRNKVTTEMYYAV